MRSRFVAVLLCLVAGLVLAQVTPSFYPHPKPRPTTGNTTNTLARVSQAFGPAAYQNDYPVAWSVDVGGGLHSRLNSIDRLNLSTNFTEEGAIVYDAAEGMYYHVGTNLIANVPLFSKGIYGLLSAPTNIYTQNGSLAGHRTVNLLGFDLYFPGTTNSRFFGTPGHFHFDANTNELTARVAMRLNVASGAKFNLKTPNVSGGTSAAGRVLTLKNSMTGEAEYEPLPAIQNIYTVNGTLTSDRSVDLNGKNLDWTDTAGSNRFQIYNVGLFSVYAKTNSQFAPEEYVVGSPSRLKIAAPSGQVGNEGRVMTLVNGANGLSDWQLVSNVYTANGTLTGDRTITAASKDFKVLGAKFIQSDAWQVGLYAQTNFWLGTPRVMKGLATVNHVLTLTNIATGGAEFMPVPADANIYNVNGTLSGIRNLNSGGFNLVLNGNNTTNPLPAEYFQVQGWDRAIFVNRTNELRSSQHLWLRAPTKLTVETPRSIANGNAATAGQVLMFAADGTSDFQSFPPFPPTLYTGDGNTGTGTRTVSGGAGNSQLWFNPFNWFVAQATNTYIIGSQVLGLQTPKIRTNAASNGWVLTLQDSATGRAEWAAPLQPTNAVNIYTQDGTLTGVRTLQSGSSANNLNFLGSNAGTQPADYFQVAFWDRAIFVNRTNELRSSQHLWLRAPTKLTVETPRSIANGNAATAGQVLTFAADGTADFQPFAPTGPDISIYTHDRALTSHRTLSGGGNDLTFNGIGNLDLQGTGIATFGAAIGTSSLRLRTRNVAAGTAAAGQVMTYQADGASEYASIPSVNTLYNNNGALADHRVVTLGDKQLWFSGSAGSQFLASPSLSHIATTGLNELTGSPMRINVPSASKFYLKTPKVTGGTAVANQILMLKDLATGEAEFEPIVVADKSIYTHTDNITDNRTVGGGSQFSLTMNNMTGITLDTTAGGFLNLIGRSKLFLNTPQAYSGVAQPGYILRLQPDRDAEFVPMPADKSIYDIDGTISEPLRTVYLGNEGRTLKFQGPGHFKVQSATTVEMTSTGTTQISATGALNLLANSSTTLSAGTGGPTITALASTGELLLDSRAGIAMRTPRTWDAIPANRPKVGEVLAYNAFGYAEYKAVTDAVGMIEYYGDGTSKASEPYTFTVPDSTVTPTYSGSQSEPPAWTRLTFRVLYHNAGGPNDGTISCFVRFGGDSATPREIVAWGSAKPKTGDLRHGSFAECIYDINLHKWVLLNFGLSGFLAATEATQITNAVTRAVSTVGAVGAVDTLSDLGGVPLTFKKISTLGEQQIGDGRHADYYLTNFDPSVPVGLAVRSTVDPSTMWKKLVSTP